VRADVPAAPGVVDQNVEAPEPVDRRGDHRLQVLVRPHVDRDERRRGTDQLGGARAVRRVDVCDHHGTTLRTEPSGERAADAHRCSRDDRDLPRQLHRPMLNPASDIIGALEPDPGE
jgi:hypothetical protein